MMIVGNWKMNQTPKKALKFIQELKSLNPQQNFSLSPSQLSENQSSPSPLNQSQQDQQNFSKKIVLLFPSVYFYMAKDLPHGVSWGGQNCFYENKGNFTGETSPQVMKEMGASYCLVGHSERRTLFNENLSLVKDKFNKIVENQMIPILCVGENLEQRKKNQTIHVLNSQLDAYEDKHFIVAYEPLWAVGTGECADKELIQEAFDEIKKRVRPEVPILYGGSVNSNKVEDLLKVKGLGGFLIGNSSLELSEFMSIYKKCE